MSDSNQQDPNQATPKAPEQAPAAPVQEKAKTFTERFQEVEKAVFQMQYVLQFHGQVVQSIMQEIQGVKENIKALKEVTAANMKLAEEGKTGTQKNLAEKITQMNADAYKQLIEKDLAEGRIRPVDTVSNDKNLVVFSDPDVMYGFQLLETFKDEEVKKGLLGKKVSEKVGELTILGIYEEVTQPSPGVPDGPQENQPAQQ